MDESGVEGDGLLTLVLGGGIVAVLRPGCDGGLNLRAVGALLMGFVSLAIGIYHWSMWLRQSGTAWTGSRARLGFGTDDELSGRRQRGGVRVDPGS